MNPKFCKYLNTIYDNKKFKIKCQYQVLKYIFDMLALNYYSNG